MPSALPGDTAANNTGANPSVGAFVIFDLLSGPKGSPKDRDVQVGYLGDPMGVWPASGNASTGGLSTGIGYGSPPIIGLTAPLSIDDAGFTDDYKPGISTPVPADSPNSVFMYLGGGKSVTSGAPSYSNPAGQAGAVPYTAGFGIGGAGNGGSRDAGAGPAFTGFGLKMVTATGAVAPGAAVEAGWVNRSGIALVTGQSVFGSSTAASAVPA